MSRARITHPLSQRHYKKVICRPQKLRNALTNIWAITWNLRGRTMTHLGSASMMAMSYHAHFAGVDNAIELLCLTARTEPADASVHYSDIRMAHDFSRNPYPGAHDRVLDPRDEGVVTRRGERPNGSWVRLALEVDRVACRAAEQNWMLPAIPNLPTFYAGFPSMSAIEMEITPALIRDIAQHMGCGIGKVKALSEPELMALASAHWPALWRAPQTAGNETGMWLINLAYVPNGMNQTPHLFEDFSGLVGMEVWNPIRDITSFKLPNPVRMCARGLSIDLNATLRTVAAGANASDVKPMGCVDNTYNAYKDQHEIQPMTPTRFSCAYDEAVDRVVALRDCLRNALGHYSKRFSDAELNTALLYPDQPLVISTTNAGMDLSQADAVRACRAHLNATRPIVSAGTTDEDLAKAVASPDTPLFASKFCNIQVLYRDPQMLREDAFNFTPGDLGRDRVYAKLWAGEGWSPRAGKVENRASQGAVAVG